MTPHSFILFIQLTFASVVLQCLVRFISACHGLVYCLISDEDHCVVIAYFREFVPIAFEEIAQGCCYSRQVGIFVKYFEVNVIELILHFVAI